MTDPFTFDPSRVELRPFCLLYADGEEGVVIAYPTPRGEIAVAAGLETTRLPAEFWIGMAFEEKVHNLTAHQRLAWIAASQEK